MSSAIKYKSILIQSNTILIDSPLSILKLEFFSNLFLFPIVIFLKATKQTLIRCHTAASQLELHFGVIIHF